MANGWNLWVWLECIGMQDVARIFKKRGGKSNSTTRVASENFGTGRYAH